MADKVIASGMSKEEVALELMRDIVPGNQRNIKNKDHVLDLYVECLKATREYRPKSDSGRPSVEFVG